MIEAMNLHLTAMAKNAAPRGHAMLAGNCPAAPSMHHKLAGRRTDV
jgi:hypothetical protein